MPPRILKAPMGVWFSCLTHTSAPARCASSGQAYCGVGGSTVRTSSAAASSSVKVKSAMAGAARSEERLVDEIARQLAVAQTDSAGSGGHEHGDELLLRIHPEVGAIGARPVEVAGAARHGGDTVLASHGEAQP